MHVMEYFANKFHQFSIQDIAYKLVEQSNVTQGQEKNNNSNITLWYNSFPSE